MRATNEVLSGQKSRSYCRGNRRPRSHVGRHPPASQGSQAVPDLVEKVLGPDLVLWATVSGTNLPDPTATSMAVRPVAAPCCSSSVHVLCVCIHRAGTCVCIFIHSQDGALLAARTPGQPDHMDRPDANRASSGRLCVLPGSHTS